MINIPIFKRKKENPIKLEGCHLPKPPQLYKQVATKIKITLLQEKMAIGGFEKISEFLRDAIKKYNENGMEEKILQLTQMVTDISAKIVKIYNTILSGLTFDERVIVEKGVGIVPNRKGDQKQLTPEELEKKSNMFKLAMEFKEVVKELGDASKLLKPVPEEELKKDRPKTDHLSFLEFKNK